MMKVIFVTYCRVMLGANKSMLFLIKDLRERYNVAPLVIIPEVNDGDLEEVLINEDIPYIVSKTKPWVVSENASLKLIRGLKSFLENKKYVSELITKLKDEKFDVVYSNNSTIQFGADLAKKMGIPHIWHVREYGKKDYQIEYSYPSKFVNSKFAQSSAVIAISQDIKNYFSENISPNVNVQVIYNGIDAKREKRSYLPYKEDICNFVCVGVLSEGKNQLELLQAAKILLNKGITNFRVYLVGDGETYKQKLLDYCNDNGLTENIIFTGYTSKVDEILEKMNVGIMCSKAEAFGRVTVEYMLATLPVIGAKGAGTSEIIIDNETGYFYTLGNPDELAYKMKNLIEDSSLSQIMGEKGFERANEFFSATKNTDNIYKLLEGVL